MSKCVTCLRVELVQERGEWPQYTRLSQVSGTRVPKAGWQWVPWKLTRATTSCSGYVMTSRGVTSRLTSGHRTSSPTISSSSSVYNNKATEDLIISR